LEELTGLADISITTTMINTLIQSLIATFLEGSVSFIRMCPGSVTHKCLRKAVLAQQLSAMRANSAVAVIFKMSFALP